MPIVQPPMMPNQRDDFDESQMFSNLELPPNYNPVPNHHFATHHTPMQPMMVTPPAPSLKKYYRVAGPHISLSTKGAYFPQGAIELTSSGDIPVFPMTASDEMLLKSPDALMSGLALEKLFESCVPAIKYPRLVSVPDIDVILLGIRMATYGNKMPLTAFCPKCKTENSFDCDLPALFSTMKHTDPDSSVKLNDEIVVYVRPYNLENATRMALVTFEETRRLQALEAGGSMDGIMRATEVDRTMKKINIANQRTMADCVHTIVIPEGKVSDKNEIYDFILNSPKSMTELIDNKISDLNKSGIEKKISACCISCEHKWETEVEFDPSNFFDAPSSK